MPYDANLDEKTFEESAEFENTKITVSVHSCNDGPKKMQVSRENFNAEGNPTFAKLGRMTKEEAEKVIPIMNKAVAEM